jgi:hypothetical protein
MSNLSSPQKRTDDLTLNLTNSVGWHHHWIVNTLQVTLHPINHPQVITILWVGYVYHPQLLS